ncbi:MAG: hypothetical protein FIA94_05270 [Nitrospirae bacterium]|nr:hypothetical protein [Nitrospirota bacterium]
MRKCTSVIALALLLFLFSSVHAADIQRLGIIPFYAPEKIWNLYTPLIEHLNKTTGYRWELKLYNDHDGIISGICKGEVAVAFLGPVPFGRAQEKCRVRPLLVALGSDGKPDYSSIIITSDPSIRSLSDVRGKRFGFFGGSTAAFVLPRQMLDEEGISIDKIIPVYFKGQDKLMEALLKHEIAAAGIKESLHEKFKDFSLEVLKISTPVPNFVFSASPALAPDVEKSFIESLRKIQPRTNPEDRRTVQNWDDEIKNGFIIAPKNYSGAARNLAELFHKYSR